MNVTVQETLDFKLLSGSFQFKHYHFEHRDGNFGPTSPTTVLHIEKFYGMSKHIESYSHPAKLQRQVTLTNRTLKSQKTPFWVILVVSA